MWRSGANAKLSLPLLGVSLSAPEAGLYNIKCQSVSTLSLRSKTLLGFHIKVLSIRVVGIIRSVRTLDPSLPACVKPLVPIGLSASASLLVSTSLLSFVVVLSGFRFCCRLFRHSFFLATKP